MKLQNFVTGNPSYCITNGRANIEGGLTQEHPDFIGTLFFQPYDTTCPSRHFSQDMRVTPPYLARRT